MYRDFLYVVSAKLGQASGEYLACMVGGIGHRIHFSRSVV